MCVGVFHLIVVSRMPRVRDEWHVRSSAASAEQDARSRLLKIASALSTSPALGCPSRFRASVGGVCIANLRIYRLQRPSERMNAR